MTATTRSTESTAVIGTTLKLAFELGSTKWTLGFTTAPAQRARVRTITAGHLISLEKEMLIAKTRDRRQLLLPVGDNYSCRSRMWPRLRLACGRLI